MRYDLPTGTSERIRQTALEDVLPTNKAFEDHEVCSPSPWLNNAMEPLIESYHPNVVGEAEFAQLIIRALAS